MSKRRRTYKATYKVIRKAMRANEVAVLRYLRDYHVGHFRNFDSAWNNALDRLLKAGRVRYVPDRVSHVGFYKAFKGAGPVTAAVRS